ncbi:MAG: hypothetical protein AABY64_06520 [Bdellovibrionota bacterium]
MRFSKIIGLSLITFFVNSSCMKVPKMEEDLGPLVEADEIADKMVTAWGNTSLEQVAKDDFLATEKTIKISTLEPHLTLRKGMTVTRLEDVTLDDQTSARYIHMLVQSEEIIQGQESKLSTREKKIGYRKETADRSANTENTASTHVLNEMARDFAINLKSNTAHTKDIEDEIQLSPYEMFRGIFFLCSQEGVECYKLETEQIEEDVTEEIRADATCRGIAGCRWKLTRVQLVAFITDTDPTTNTETKSKAIIKLKISKDLPFLSRLVEYCYEGITTYQSQKFPVSVCHKLKDFQRGPPATTP